MTWRSALALVLAHRGALKEGELLAREAAKIAAETDDLNGRADALLRVAEILSLAGRHQEAALLGDQACALYELKGNVLSGARAGRFVGDLRKTARNAGPA